MSGITGTEPVDIGGANIESSYWITGVSLNLLVSGVALLTLADLGGAVKVGCHNQDQESVFCTH